MQLLNTGNFFFVGARVAKNKEGFPGGLEWERGNSVKKRLGKKLEKAGGRGAVQKTGERRQQADQPSPSHHALDD
jgi:hypothetical protein